MVAVPTTTPRHVAFVLEQTLGHVTHSRNLHTLVPGADDRVQAHFLPVPFDTDLRIPGWSNWSVRASWRAHRLLADLDTEADAIFVHTQVPALLLGRRMRRTPTVVSIDATPLQYDELGEFYAHERSAAPIERMKFHANRRTFRNAAHLVAWSAWAKSGLIDGYGVKADDITVVPPGVDIDRWTRTSPREVDDRTVRVLFVGGDLARKGGDLLIDACRRLNRSSDQPTIELHLVTGADVATEPGVVVHRGLTPNSPELIAQYHAADIFCLPTLGDCLPMVLPEAAAAELPLVSTRVGAIPEIVQPGITGELVEPGDLDGLTQTLERLVLDADRRRSLGRGARALVERDHDARANAARLVGLLCDLADQNGQ